MNRERESARAMTLPETQQSTKSHELSNQTYWRALYYFNLYRLVLSVALTSIALSGAKIAKLGERNPELFAWACLSFAAMAVFNMITITRGTPAFRQQAYFQFTADAVLITLLAHASGGIGSGLSLLLMVSVAGAGVVLSGRMTVFFAALCTTFAFSEHFVARSLHYVIDGNVTQIGLLGIGLFSTGLILSYASTRIRRTEALAEQRREALADMAMINQMVVARMDTGVIVLNAQGDVELANDTAKALAGHPPSLQAGAPGLSRRRFSEGGWWSRGESNP